jgi:flagellar biogenesis protein FliO
MSGSKTEAAMSEFKIHAAAEGARSPDSSSLLTRLLLPILALLRSVKIQRRERFMRICETLPLGEKRFLAIVQIEQQRFLIATTNQSISLLYCLDDSGLSHPGGPANSSDSRQDGNR